MPTRRQSSVLAAFYTFGFTYSGERVGTFFFANVFQGARSRGGYRAALEITLKSVGGLESLKIIKTCVSRAIFRLPTRVYSIEGGKGGCRLPASQSCVIPQGGITGFPQ